MTSVSMIQSNMSYNAYPTQSQRNTPSPNFEAILQQRMQKMEDKVETGQIDPAELQAKLQERFGDVVNEAFGDDGSVDFDKLTAIIEEQMESMPPPPPPDGGLPPAGIDSSSSQNPADALTSALDDIVTENSATDYEKLSEWLQSLKNAAVNGHQSPFGDYSFVDFSSSMNAAMYASGALFSAKA